MTSGPRRRPRRIHPYVAKEVAERLQKYCAASGATESAVVEAALRQHLDGTSDRTLLFRRLDRIGRGVGRMQRDLELQAEAFGVFVRVWFAHTPNVAGESRRAAQSGSEARYRQYAQYVAEQFSMGKRFLDDLPREHLDEAEAAQDASSEPGT